MTGEGLLPDAATVQGLIARAGDPQRERWIEQVVRRTGACRHPIRLRGVVRRGGELVYSTAGEPDGALMVRSRITLAAQTSQPPGVTGLRALAAVLSQHGEDTMLAIYDKAALLRPGRAVVDTTVNLAVRGLLMPPVTLDAPAVGQDASRGERDDGDTVVDVDVDEDGDEDPEAVHELHDRLIEIRRALDDLGAVTSELAAIRGRQQAQRILDDLIEEIHELPDALAAAIASHPTDPTPRERRR